MPLARFAGIALLSLGLACWQGGQRAGTGGAVFVGMLTYNGGEVLDAKSWDKSPEPVFQKSDENSVFGPGHNGFFKSPDGTEDWIVYHANDNAGDGCVGKRTTRVQKFTWNADGTPNFGTPVSTTMDIPNPSGDKTIDPYCPYPGKHNFVPLQILHFSTGVVHITRGQRGHRIFLLST